MKGVIFKEDGYFQVEAENGKKYPISQTSLFEKGFGVQVGKIVDFDIERRYTEDGVLEYAILKTSVTRVEIISKENGRERVIRDEDIELSFQDANKTLKVFVGYKEETKKQPLFKTFDGVDIFEGDEYFFIWLATPAQRQTVWTPYSAKAKKLNADESFSENAVFFSTANAVIEYIKKFQNYTYNDGERIKNGESFFIYSPKFYKCLHGVFGQFVKPEYDGKRFRTKEEVEKLIQLNKPQYSLKQIKDLVNNWSMCVISEEDILNKIKNYETL